MDEKPVNLNDLRKKFPAKVPAKGGKSSKAAVKAIAREYELKKAMLTGGAPVFKKGIAFYGIIVLFLAVVGSLVIPQILSGGLTLGKKRIERNDLHVRKAIDSLTVALGRYKYHVGEYPSTEEGLAVLAYRRPEEIRMVRRRHKGWNGWYVGPIVKDPWGHDYVYETRPEGGHPVLYSKGPDGRAGTTDDVLPDQLLFDEPFRDTSWTNHWVPAELRGIIIAPDEETRRKIQEEMEKY